MTTNPTANGWQKLIKHGGALTGIVIIAFSGFIAIFAYLIAPDATPNANRMIVEIGGKQPGFKQQFFLYPKETVENPGNWISLAVHGRPDAFQFIPVDGYTVKDHRLIIKKYIDEGISEKIEYSLSRLKVPVEKNFVTRTFLLGTDKYGRDMMSRLLVGVRVSLLVGGIAMLLSLTIGVLLGALAGYYGGKMDSWIMWLINVIWSIPTLLLVFAVTLLLGKGFMQVFIAVGLTMWVNVARIVRGQMLGIRKLEYVEAAKALGYSDLRIITKHILPNIMGPVLVVAAANFASAIIIEAGLSFLGVGVQPPQPSWGGMIRENYNFIITNNPMLALAPGFAIMLLVLAFNLLGNGIRDVLDVRG
ncbi:ABC transporter permease [Flavihumibacter profundi]|uniref:ABC transporter permease n=1 Tax=Flavihumibacter profundi TaxID=2716883 RepID=UPI001CC3EF7A|nr:ABC transporter permease [Flavihumibacter profundi]MBZ5858952.1 ABC transporter permease [Flavihumibacter profundi]